MTCLLIGQQDRIFALPCFTPWVLYFVLVFLVGPPPVLAAGNLILRIGYLSSADERIPVQAEQELQTALLMAAKDVNEQGMPPLLPNITLAVILKKVDGNGNITNSFDDLVQTGVVSVFGNEPVCDNLASLSGIWNKIFFSHVCGTERFADHQAFPTTLRIHPPDSQLAESMLLLLQRFNWSQVSLVVQNTTKWLSMSTTLETLVSAKPNFHLSVVNRRLFQDNRLCCARRSPCCNLAWLYSIFQDTKSSTKTYVFLGDRQMLREFLLVIEDAGGHSADRFAVVSCDPEAFSPSKAFDFLQQPRDLLHSADRYTWPSGLLAEARKFHVYGHSVEKSWLPPSASPLLGKANKKLPALFMVTRRAGDEPFTLFAKRLRSSSIKRHDPLDEKAARMSVSITAAYAYDAVTVLAQALSLLTKTRSLTVEQIAEAAKNGRGVLQAIQEIQNFSTVRGGVLSCSAVARACEDSFIALGSRNVFTSQNAPVENVPESLLVPIGYFRSSMFHPILEPNRSRIELLSSARIEHGDEVGRPEALNGHKLVTVIVAHLLVLSGAAYALTRHVGKSASKINGFTFREFDSSEEDLKSFLRDVHLMRVMNSPPTNPDFDWRTPVWMKTFDCTPAQRVLHRQGIKELQEMRQLYHENVSRLLCAVIEPTRIHLLTEFSLHRSLWDILSEDACCLSDRTVDALAMDLIKGLKFLHETHLHHHGNLKSTNCLVDRGFSLKISNFGLVAMRDEKASALADNDFFTRLLWRAPELLRDPINHSSQEADVYSFGIILHELVVRRGPFEIFDADRDSKTIVDLVRAAVPVDASPYRPSIAKGLSNSSHPHHHFFACMENCWAEEPEERPTVECVYQYLTKLVKTPTEDVVEEKRRQLEEEIAQIDQVLHRIIPKTVASRLANGEAVDPELWENVTVFEADLVGFTKIASETTPLGTMILLDDVYTLFDSIARGYDVCKLGTIGDAYIVVSGIDSKRASNHAGEIASMALDIVEELQKGKIQHRGKPLVVRIGVHSGPVVTGVIGASIQPTYSIFGDTVNAVSVLESTSSELRIQISEASYLELQKMGGYLVEERKDGPIVDSAKTYWLTGRTEKAIQRKQTLDSCALPLCDRQSVVSLTMTDIFIDPDREQIS